MIITLPPKKALIFFLDYSKYILFYYLFIKLYILRDLIDSHTDNTDRSWVLIIQFTPMITSYKIIEKYQRQDININTVKIQNISFTTRVLQIALL